MLVGTAGHIDHGKTTLIRALTGVDTDRLPEEKRRGISIDLGFAYLPGDDAIGFVDVPGHERFVPTMLAGATGIDFALLVVAADDGPMPQTREHLDILRLLGIARGAVVLTKIDRASAEQRAQAEAALDALLADTPFAAAPRFAVAAPTGAGIAALRDHLLAEARVAAAAPEQPVFRLAIDRSFSIAGAGAVVTGTVHAGRVAVGDNLVVVRQDGGAPLTVRVRSLHANNCPAERAGRGMRCALNLAGISHHDAARGDWLVSAPLAEHASRHLDVELYALPDTEGALRPGIDLHLHHGSGHGMGRLIALAPEPGSAGPGGESGPSGHGAKDRKGGLWQVVSRAPLLACHGDLLILRDASGQRTLAGARVLDPAGPQRHRARPERLAQLAALRTADPDCRLAALLAATPLGIDVATFALAANAPVALPSDAVAVDTGGGRLRAFAVDHFAALGERVDGLLADYHARHPDELGLERERLRRIAVPQLDGRSFLALLGRWKDTGRLAQTGSAWHLPSPRVDLSGGEAALAERVLPLLLEPAYDPPWVRDLAARLETDEAAMRHVLRKLAAQGAVFQIVRDLFYHRDAVVRLAGLVRRLAAGEDEADKAGGLAGGADGATLRRDGAFQHAAGATPPSHPLQPVKAAAFRDHTGLGRKRAIQILEFFDRVGFTRRIGVGQSQAHVIRGEPPAE